MLKMRLCVRRCFRAGLQEILRNMEFMSWSGDFGGFNV